MGQQQVVLLKRCAAQKHPMYGGGDDTAPLADFNQRLTIPDFVGVDLQCGLADGVLRLQPQNTGPDTGLIASENWIVPDVSQYAHTTHS